MTRIGLNLDPSLVEDQDDLVSLGVRAACAGYQQIWVAARTMNPFQTIARIDDQLHALGMTEMALGIPVIPVSSWPDPDQLARTATGLRCARERRFTFGLGVGHPSSAIEGTTLDRRPVEELRAYLVELRASLARLANPAQEVYVGALGPAMLRLAGELGDGVVLNWTAGDHIGWSRRRIDEGYQRSYARARTVSVITQLRVCISEDIPEARRTLARQMVAMTLRDPIERPDRGYRAHMARLGHGELFDDLARQLSEGIDRPRLADQVPAAVVDSLGYAGPASGAQQAIQRLANGADGVLIRIVPSLGNQTGVIEALEACAPQHSSRLDSQ